MSSLSLTVIGFISVANVCLVHAEETHILKPVPIGSVHVEDPFWTAKLETWNAVTLKDVLDKFETAGAFRNFDRVAGLREGKHEGPPWFDGLIYETLRGASDFLISFPDKELEDRIDGYIQRIARAQAVDPDGYLMTYTQLDEPGHRWGQLGGFLRWQHDVYNAGALAEAGVHHYRATGNVDLLRVAARLASHMSDIMGPPPRKNIVPAHSLPEEALVEMYLLFKDDPSLKDKLNIPVHEDRFLALAEFWLESRGRHGGRPTSEQWDHQGAECERWVREQAYGNQRPSWGAYAQDHQPVFQQETLEGHAVRATLMCTGLSAAARVNGRSDYAHTALRLWENMAGKRMHITGGVGAFAHEEKFGPDYALPNDAYLETCAAVGAGFFHRNMNLLFGDARYVDELERVLYNNVINGVSLEGTRYYYQNPLSARGHRRWKWHGCPCCPPMFLKMVSALPGYLYAYDAEGLYVNLFVGSRAEFSFNHNPISVVQKTGYPWKGTVTLVLEPENEMEFALHVRVPGWARGRENPFGLYTSDLQSKIAFTLNGKKMSMLESERGYAVIKRKWKRGDEVVLELPLQPRRVHAHPEVESDEGRCAIQSGPLVYCIEEQDNPGMDSYFLEPGSPFSLEFDPEVLGGVNIVKGQASSVQQDRRVEPVTVRAIPFYGQDNREQTARMAVWLPEEKELASPMPPATIAGRAHVLVSYCFEHDTQTALNDGREPANSNDHSIARHTWWDHRGTAEWAQYEFDRPRRISSVSVYWWDDRPSGGRCAAPESWTLLYRTEDAWEPVSNPSEYGILLDQYNTTTFTPVTTKALRLEVHLREHWSGGILEWKVK